MFVRRRCVDTCVFKGVLQSCDNTEIIGSISSNVTSRVSSTRGGRGGGTDHRASFLSPCLRRRVTTPRTLSHWWQPGPATPNACEAVSANNRFWSQKVPLATRFVQVHPTEANIIATDSHIGSGAMKHACRL